MFFAFFLYLCAHETVICTCSRIDLVCPAGLYVEKITKEFNAKMPVGYRCLNTSYGWYEDDGTQYWLILLIVIIIYFICAILFESLRLPLVWNLVQVVLPRWYC